MESPGPCSCWGGRYDSVKKWKKERQSWIGNGRRVGEGRVTRTFVIEPIA